MKQPIQHTYITLLTVLLLALLAACSSTDYTGDISPDEFPMEFSCDRTKSTRATTTPLSTQIQDFKLYGINIKGSTPTYQTIFPNYKFVYTNNSANTTESNSSNWDYVGTFEGHNQTIKYWDLDASKYIFWAIGNSNKVNSSTFTLDEQKHATRATISVSDSETGDLTPEKRVYYTKPHVVVPSAYKETVKLQFVSAMSRVRFGFYETIPGYAVKDMKFYVDAESTNSPDLKINGKFASEGNLVITYDNDKENNYASTKATVEWDNNSTPLATMQSKKFGTLNYTFANENKLTGTTNEDKIYLGKLSTNATYSGTGDGYYSYILPYSKNDTPLNIKCDYTLVSTDGSGQEINKKGVMATVPAQYCQWKPNYSYTYLFKLTDSALTPITFVAYGEIDNTIDNQQGTITTIGEYSITTYQEGSVIEGGIDYVIAKDMEVSVVFNTGKTPDATNDFKEISLDGTKDYVIIYHQATKKEWVVEELPEGWDAANPDKAPKDGVYLETLECTGTTDGYKDGKAHFIPDVFGTYRVEYWHKEGEGEPEQRAVKIVKIRGNETELEEYEKWQNGSSNTTTW